MQIIIKSSAFLCAVEGEEHHRQREEMEINVKNIKQCYN